MSKALVIKGANFYANRLDTVTLQEIVPCESISLSHNSLSFTAIGQTAQLSATVTPIDTTDSVIWQTSDENCVTVVNGLVACVGVGTATITATCGTKSAVCEITSTVTLSMSGIGAVIHKSLTSTDLSVDPPKDYLSIYGTETGQNLRKILLYSTIPTESGINLFHTGLLPSADDYPIMLPNNASKVEITIPNTLSFHTSPGHIQFVDSTKHYTYDLSPHNGAIAKTNIISLTSDGKTVSYDIPEVEGIDSFTFDLMFTSQIDEIPEGLVIKIT